MALQLMGEAAVGAFLQSVLRDLTAVIGKRHNFFLDFNPELKKLEKVLSRFQDVLVDGERRRLGEKSVDKWMDDLKDLLYDTDDILDEIDIEVQQLEQTTKSQPIDIQVVHNFSNVYHSSNSIRSKICKVLDTIDELAQEADYLTLRRDVGRHYFNWGTSQAILRPETVPSIDESEIHGREKDKESIIDMLLAEDDGTSKKNYEVICITGMGGLGKTTLAQLVFQDQRVESFFKVKSWACVSDVFDVTKVTKELVEYAAQVGGMPNVQSLAALQARLKSIVNNNRFLLVLDDVWTTKEWDKLKAPLSFGAKGSKIVVTTRLRKVSDAISSKSPYQLRLLDYDQCWAIFKDKAFHGIDADVYHEDLVKSGQEIVKKCGGLPLAVKVIGAMLRGAEEERWKALLQNELWHLAYENDEIHPALRLSYFYLPSFLKRCFEYFAIFPSDYTFNRGELVRMWIAEGIIEVKEGIIPEDVGSQYYNDLKGRSLIQENDKLHDIMHHLACVISGKFFYRAKSGSNSCTNSLASVRHASIGVPRLDSSKVELHFEANRLRTLIHGRGFADYSHQKIWSYKRFRVLDFSSRFSLSELPSSIGDLKHLRYLNLGSCKLIRHLPDSICTLSNLQVLNLVNCVCLQNLPQDMGNLSNLRYLRLSSTKISSLPESICALHSLRVLDLSHCRYLTHLPKDIGNLQSLHEVRLWPSSILSVPESILNVKGLHVLEVQPGSNLPAHIGKLKSLEVLMWYPVGKEKGRRIDELKDMNRLKGRLIIANMENIGSVEEAVTADLTSKKHIEELDFVWKRDGEMETKIMEALEPNAALKSLTFVNYGGHSFPSWMLNARLLNLTRLKMVELPMMERVAALELPSLKVLEISNCPTLREVSMATPKLESLAMRNCWELEPAAVVLLPSLSNIALERLDCDYYYLDYFLQQAQAKNASCTKLKRLWVDVDQDDSITSLPAGWPNILTSLVFLKLEGLPPSNFQILTNEDQNCCPPSSLVAMQIHNCPSLTCLPSDLCNFSVRSLIIENCPGLVSLERQELPVPSLLEFVRIENCRNLMNLPDGLCNFASLVHLYLYNCPNLVIRSCDLLPPKIVSVYIRYCSKLEEQLENEDRADWQSHRS